jgi:hypothetical protein
LIECAAMSVNDPKQTSGLRTMKSQITSKSAPLGMFAKC